MKVRLVAAAAAGGLWNMVKSTDEKPQHLKTMRIGIIGGGIGGTSTAYFVRKELESKYKDSLNLSIDLIEKEKIGGRLQTLQLGDRFYEAGGSIIHDKNEYMQRFVKQFGLEKRDDNDKSRLGLWNGTKFVFTGADSDLITDIKFLWHYGWDVIRLNRWIKSMLKDFCKIYELQDGGMSYKSVADLVCAMNPQFSEDMRKISLNEKLIGQSYSKRFIDELATAATRANYGQFTSMPAFVGYVSLCGAMPGLWSVKGGNHKVAECLLEKSGAHYVHAEVTCVTRNEAGTYTVRCNSARGEVEEKEYDVVVLAMPFIQNDRQAPAMRFKNVSPQPCPAIYQQTVATLIRGTPKYSIFAKAKNRCPNDIIVVNPHTIFATFAQQSPVDYKKGEKLADPVWKIFSAGELNEREVGVLFDVVHDVKRVPWLAYPHYDVQRMPDKLDFELSPRLYYVNCIEWASSCMEMSVIAARNIALLISCTVDTD